MYPVLTDPNLREFLQLDDGIQLALEAECRTAGAAAVSAHIGAWVRACMRPFPSRANGLSTREGGTGAPPHVPSAVTDRVCVRVLQRSALPPTAAAAPCTPCRHRPGAPPDCAPSLKARPASPMWCWRRCWLLGNRLLWPCGPVASPIYRGSNRYLRMMVCPCRRPAAHTPSTRCRRRGSWHRAARSWWTSTAREASSHHSGAATAGAAAAAAPLLLLAEAARWSALLPLPPPPPPLLPVGARWAKLPMGGRGALKGRGGWAAARLLWWRGR